MPSLCIIGSEIGKRDSGSRETLYEIAGKERIWALDTLIIRRLGSRESENETDGQQKSFTAGKINPTQQR